MSSNISPNISVIKLEFIHGRQPDGSVNNINNLAKKYGVPKQTLYDIAHRKDSNGLNWYDLRDRELSIIDNEIGTKMRAKNIKTIDNQLENIEQILTTNLDNLLKVSKGYNFKTKKVDVTKIKPLAPTQLIKLVDMGIKLNQLRANLGSGTIVPLELPKAISDMSIDELEQLEQKVMNYEEGVTSEAINDQENN